jgi:hypothetical protein
MINQFKQEQKLLVDSLIPSHLIKVSNDAYLITTTQPKKKP